MSGFYFLDQLGVCNLPITKNKYLKHYLSNKIAFGVWETAGRLYPKLGTEYCIVTATEQYISAKYAYIVFPLGHLPRLWHGPDNCIFGKQLHCHFVTIKTNLQDSKASLVHLQFSKQWYSWALKENDEWVLITTNYNQNFPNWHTFIQDLIWSLKTAPSSFPNKNAEVSCWEIYNNVLFCYWGRIQIDENKLYRSSPIITKILLKLCISNNKFNKQIAINSKKQ